MPYTKQDFIDNESGGIPVSTTVGAAVGGALGYGSKSFGSSVKQRLLSALAGATVGGGLSYLGGRGVASMVGRHKYRRYNKLQDKSLDTIEKSMRDEGDLMYKAHGRGGGWGDEYTNDQYDQVMSSPEAIQLNKDTESKLEALDRKIRALEPRDGTGPYGRGFGPGGGRADGSGLKQASDKQQGKHMNKEAYDQGFIAACNANGVDPQELVKVSFDAPGTIQGYLDKGNKYLYKHLGSKGRDMVVNGLGGAAAGVAAQGLYNAVMPETEMVNTPYGKVKMKRRSNGARAYLRAALLGGGVGAGIGAYKNYKGY